MGSSKKFKCLGLIQYPQKIIGRGCVVNRHDKKFTELLKIIRIIQKSLFIHNS